MVAKTPEPQVTPNKIQALEKENAEMKTVLSGIYQTRKINDLIWTVLWGIIVYGCIGFLYDMARMGGNAVIIQDNMSEVGGALLLGAISLCYIIAWVYVVWTTLATVIIMFQNEIRAFGKRLIVFIQGGSDALKETSDMPENAESEPQITTGKRRRCFMDAENKSDTKSEPDPQAGQKTIISP